MERMALAGVAVSLLIFLPNLVMASAASLHFAGISEAHSRARRQSGATRGFLLLQFWLCVNPRPFRCCSLAYGSISFAKREAIPGVGLDFPRHSGDFHGGKARFYYMAHVSVACQAEAFWGQSLRSFALQRPERRRNSVTECDERVIFALTTMPLAPIGSPVEVHEQNA